MATPTISRFFQETEDGRYLIRPHGGLGGVYSVDVEARDKFVRYRRTSGLPYLGIMLLWVFNLVGVFVMGLMLAVWVIVDVFIRQRFVKGGEKIDKALWQAPVRPKTGPLFPKWCYVVFIPLELIVGFFAVQAAYVLMVRPEPLNADSQFAIIFLVLITALVLFLLWLSYKSLTWKPTE